MYNRYLHNDHGTYTRISPPPPYEAPPTQQSPSSADHSFSKANLTTAVEKGGKTLSSLLKALHLQDINRSDLMLLALLFFLFEEDADEELLIALGLLLIL